MSPNLVEWRSEKKTDWCPDNKTLQDKAGAFKKPTDRVLDRKASLPNLLGTCELGKVASAHNIKQNTHKTMTSTFGRETSVTGMIMTDRPRWNTSLHYSQNTPPFLSGLNNGQIKVSTCTCSQSKRPSTSTASSGSDLSCHRATPAPNVRGGSDLSCHRATPAPNVRGGSDLSCHRATPAPNVRGGSDL